MEAHPSLALTRVVVQLMVALAYKTTLMSATLLTVQALPTLGSSFLERGCWLEVRSLH